MLLYDRKVTADGLTSSLRLDENINDSNEIEVDGGTCGDVQKDEKPAQIHLPSIEERKFDSEFRQFYHEYLHEKYLEKLEQYNENLNQKLNSLNEIESKSSADVTRATSTAMSIERKSFRDFCVTETSTLLNAPVSTSGVVSAIATAPPAAVAITPDIKDPALKKIKRKIKKNMRFSRNDIRTGEFYFDPFLLEKVHNPEKGMKIMKNYTSLMRSQSNLRKRLQVNASSFEEERCGNFYHRLVTEWDQFYISEIRHRPKFQKFCKIHIRKRA